MFYKMMIAVALMGALAGCQNSSREIYFSAMPADFKDCKIVRVTNDEGTHITLARCPNSTTTATVPNGKTTLTTITVDGVTYEKKEK